MACASPGHQAERAKPSRAWCFCEDSHCENMQLLHHRQPPTNHVLSLPASSNSIQAADAGSSETVDVPQLKLNGGYEASRPDHRPPVCKHDAPNNDKYCMDWTIPDNCTLLTPQVPCPHSVLPSMLPSLNTLCCSTSSSCSGRVLRIWG